MKKTILVKSALALAIAAATSAPTVAQMTDDVPDITGVSGRFRVAVICDDQTETCTQEDYGGRFRMAAEEDLGNGNTIFGRYEFAVDASDGTLQAGGKAQRLAYVGIKGGFGEFSLGSRWSAFYNVVSSPVDWTKAFGGTWRAGIEKGGFRQHNSLFYKIEGFQAMVTVAEDDANEDIDIVEVGYTAALGTFNIGVAGRFSADAQEETTEAVIAQQARPGVGGIGVIPEVVAVPAVTQAVEVENLYGLNVNTNVGGVRLSASYYTQGDDDSILAQVQAPMGGGTVSFSIGQNLPDTGVDNSMLALEYERGLGPNSAWFVGIEHLDPDDGTEDRTVYGAGLHYNFN